MIEKKDYLDDKYWNLEQAWRVTQKKLTHREAAKIMDVPIAESNRAESRYLINILVRLRDYLYQLQDGLRSSPADWSRELLRDFISATQGKITAIEKRIHFLSQTGPARDTIAGTRYDANIIKEQITIDDIMPTRAVTKIGDRWWYKSPWRDEKTASLCYYIKTNSFCDYGDRSKSGDIFILYQLLNECSFPQAVQALGRMCQ